MRKITGLLVALVVGSTIGFAITNFYKPGIRKMLLSKTSPVTAPEAQEDEFKKAQAYLKASKPVEAMKIISNHTEEIESQSAEGKKWLDLLVKASVEAHDIDQLGHVYNFDPSALSANENASLLVADALVNSGNSEGYNTLRSMWKHNQNPDRWFILDVDALILEKKPHEAVRLLQSQTLTGANDTTRLIRLALLHMNDQPKTAWNYLTEAQRKNPDSTDVRTYRARFLESIGKPELALTEYLAAVSADPTSPYLKDQLAEFYVRTHKFDQALNVWSNALKPPTSDSIWLNSIFWSRSIAPIQFNWKDAQPPEGYEKPLIEYLLSLQPGEFWDRKTFDENPDLAKYLINEQTTYWLRLMQYLKNGDEDQAFVLSQYNPFADQSYDSQLLEALQRVLNYRRNGTLKLTKDLTAAPKAATVASTDAKTNPLNGDFFGQLDTLAQSTSGDDAAKEDVSADLQELLKSPEVFSALFLSGGWREAGLQLHKVKIIPPDFPTWVSYNIAEAYRSNRSVTDALRFASLQKKTPSISLLTAELMISNGNTDAGMVELEKLATDSTDVGYRASWLLSLIYLERKQLDDAKKVITSNPKLEQSLMGQEALGRIAVLQGDNPGADKIYNGIVDQSIEAKSYLARKAFADKDWTKAQQMTEELLKLYPSNQVLKDNLQKIQKEQGNLKQ